MNLEKRFGSSAGSMSLQLQNKDGVLVCDMPDDYQKLGFYNPQEDFIIHCIDTDPHSIVRGLENFEMVEKYVMSDQDYDNLPMNVKKFKSKIKQNNPELFVPKGMVGKNGIIIDPEHQKDISEKITVGDRCEIIKDGLRLIIINVSYFLCIYRNKLSSIFGQ